LCNPSVFQKGACTGWFAGGRISLIIVEKGRYSIMEKRERCHAEDAERLLRKQKIATMPELKEALGTRADITVFRKLGPLDYRTSYSHRGRYYTLEAIAQFDERGLWSHEGVWFSKWGTLLAAAEHWVANAEAGYFARELKGILHVEVKEALLKLVRQGRLARKRVPRGYLYLAAEASARKRQLLASELRDTQEGFAAWAASDETKAAIVLFVSLLDEKQRRLYAGLESLKLGRGGDRKIAELTHMDAQTVARGRGELLARDVEVERVRRGGGGRKRLEKKRPK